MAHAVLGRMLPSTPRSHVGEPGERTVSHPDELVEAAMLRVQAGDRAAFAVVVERYARPLRAWLAPRCPPEVEPDEVAHCVLVKAFTAIAMYRPGSNPGAWLWAIARAQLLGAVTEASRRRARASVHAPGILADLAAARAAEPDDDPRLEALGGCLERLGEGARDLLRRRYELEQPIAAMATELGRSAGALKKALFTIRERLHECLQGRLGAEGDA